MSTEQKDETIGMKIIVSAFFVALGGALLILLDLPIVGRVLVYSGMAVAIIGWIYLMKIFFSDEQKRKRKGNFP